MLATTVTTAFSLLVCEAAQASHDTTRQVLSASLLAVGEANLPLSLKSRLIGTGALTPASFAGVCFTVSVAAAHQGGLPLITGMAVFAGLVQLLIARTIHRLRPYLPTEIAGFAMLMSGLILGVIGLNRIAGVAVTSDVMSAGTKSSAALGLASLLATIDLFI